MKKTTILMLLFSATLCFANGPQIEFVEEEFDFGKVKQYSEIHHVFTFYNTGDEPLIIEKIDAG